MASTASSEAQAATAVTPMGTKPIQQRPKRREQSERREPSQSERREPSATRRLGCRGFGSTPIVDTAGLSGVYYG